MKIATIATMTCPVIHCRRVPGSRVDTLQFYCPYCKRNHIHGAAGPEFGAGDGHRAAHCSNQNSPYLKTDYILQEVRE